MLTLQGTIEIKTNRLLLRKFKNEDSEQAFNNWQSDEEVTKYLTWSAYKTLEDAKKYRETEVIPNYGNNNFCSWAIVYNGEVVGAIDARIDEDKRSANMGFVLGKKWWGKGIMPEALQAVIDYLFSHGITRIGATHKIENPNSGRVMEKCGMICEGTSRESAKDGHGNIHDSKVYSITNEKLRSNQIGRKTRLL